MDIAIRNMWVKGTVFLSAFAVCVTAYLLPDKSHFEQLKYIYQALLIGLLFAEYGRERLIHSFIAFTIVTWIYIAPYKAQTDLVSIIIEIILLALLYRRWKYYFMLNLLNILVIANAVYGLLKELSGWGEDYIILDWVAGGITILILFIALTKMLFRNAKQ